MCAFFVCVFTSITYTVPLCHHVDRHIFKFLIVPDYSQVSYVVVLTSKALCVVQAFGARQCVTPNTLCHSPIAPSLLAQIYTCDRSKNMNKSPSKGCVGLDSYGLCIASMTACGIVLPGQLTLCVALQVELTYFFVWSPLPPGSAGCLLSVIIHRCGALARPRVCWGRICRW